MRDKKFVNMIVIIVCVVVIAATILVKTVRKNEEKESVSMTTETVQKEIQEATEGTIEKGSTDIPEQEGMVPDHYIPTLQFVDEDAMFAEFPRWARTAITPEMEKFLEEQNLPINVDVYVFRDTLEMDDEYIKFNSAIEDENLNLCYITIDIKNQIFSFDLYKRGETI